MDEESESEEELDGYEEETEAEERERLYILKKAEKHTQIKARKIQKSHKIWKI